MSFPWFSERRVVFISQPSHLGQWWKETGEFNILDPRRSTLEHSDVRAINILGKTAAGIWTMPDAVANHFFNPNLPQSLSPEDSWPRTARQIRQIGLQCRTACTDLLEKQGWEKAKAVLPLAMGVYHAHSELPGALAMDVAQKIGGGAQHNGNSARI